MTTQKESWKVGDIFYEAGGTLHGREWDIGAEPRRTEEEAKQDAADWLFWLSDNEKQSAATYVTRYKIDALDDDGSIGSAHSFYDE